MVTTGGTDDKSNDNEEKIGRETQARTEKHSLTRT